MKKIIRLDPIILHSNYNNRSFSIDVTYSETAHSKPVILFVHGFKGFKDWGFFNQLAGYFAENGFVFVKMNFSHNGTTPDHPVDFVDLEAFGKNNFSIEQDDMDNVLNWLQDYNNPIPDVEVDRNKILLLGHSRGGAAAVLKAWHDQRIKGVSAWAAINDLGHHFSKKEIQQWKSAGVMYIDNVRTGQRMPLYFQLAEDFDRNRNKFDVPRAIRELRIPFQLIHGSEDETLPVEMAHQSKRWNPRIELVILKGADHTFGGKHPWKKLKLPVNAEKAADATIEFFRRFI